MYEQKPLFLHKFANLQHIDLKMVDIFMKKLFLILMAFIPLFGCSARNRADLTYFRYSFGSTMRANGGEEWTTTTP